MESFTIHGGTPLRGDVTLSGAKNVALKAVIASLLTDEPVTLGNIPNIADVREMLVLLSHLGVRHTRNENGLALHSGGETSVRIPLEAASRIRASALLLGPLLSRYGSAVIPNPGGCRIGARPINRHIDALRAMGATIEYSSDDGYFHAKTEKLHGATIRFEKNTHTGTEAVILAAVLAEGETVIENAAEEVEVDDLIGLLNAMGASITRPKPRTIVIKGVDRLHGTTYGIMPDRNEEVTYAIAAAATSGKITIRNSQFRHLKAFSDAFTQAGGRIETGNDGSVTYSGNPPFRPVDIITRPHPGFMTDWQAPWAVLMTLADGTATIHETVFESRFSYVDELVKMGASIEFFDPPADDPAVFYNFNWSDRKNGSHQGIRIKGPARLHNAVLEMNDLRAGATLVIAALTAPGESVIHGVSQIDRGYECIDERIRMLGGDIARTQKEEAA